MKEKIHKSILIIIGLIALISSATAQLPSEIDTSGTWYLSWSDEFDYKDSQLNVNWESQNGPSGHILCSRWRENVLVADGILQLVNKKENRGGQEWTSGSIWTKKWFKYGYFECRYKYAAAGATNNSFWLMNRGDKPSEGDRFEIDINEGHFPNEVNTNIHNHGDVHTSSAKSHAFGITPDVNIPLEIPITTKKLRFSSHNLEHFHIREFRIYNDNERNFPEVMSESADSDVDGLINHVKAEGTKITVSGTLRDEFDKSRMVDGMVLSTSWISQKEGEKWIEFEFAEDKTIGCIQFINGWKDGDTWKALINDYKIEYWDGGKWVEMLSLDLASDNTFADVYHTLGLKWDEKEIVFYLDGEELRREKNEFCFSAVPIWLSLAIIEWSGPVTDDIDGTSMKVDYVRYYQKKEESKIKTKK
nr:family 16 glycosylhydrolase [uncultured Marinifilum sp.]